MKSADQEIRELRAALGSLCGFASTARRINNPEWMYALCERINKALAVLGDTETVHWEEKGDWIYTKSEAERQNAPD